MKFLVFLLLASLAGNGYQYLFRTSPSPQEMVESKERAAEEPLDREKKRGGVAFQPEPSQSSPSLAPSGLSGALKSRDQKSPNSNSPCPQQPRAFADNPPSFEEEQVREAERKWEEGLQSYFKGELALDEEDYAFYQEVIKELGEQTAEIHRYFSEQARDRGWDPLHPYVPSFEQERAIFWARESVVDRLGRRFDSEKLKKLLEYERKFKEKMLREEGYSLPRGLL